MPGCHTTSRILEAVLERMAAGHGVSRAGRSAHFDGTVQVDATKYHVVVDWPDGAGAGEVAPQIEGRTWTVLTDHRGEGWEPRAADLTLAEAQRLAQEFHHLYRDQVRLAPSTEDHRRLVALGDCT